MPTAKPVIRKRRERWRKVQAAQDYIAGQSLGIAKSLVKAARKGDAVTGRWLLEHTAIVDPDGKERRPLSSTIDRQVVAAQDSGGNVPRIMIGVNLGADFAQLATGASPGRTALPPAESPIPLSQPVSPDARPRQIPNVIDAEPVLATHEEPEPRV
jgi:hypothetical protein